MTPSDFPREIVSLVLFGSVARGDADSASDRDVCVVMGEVGFEQFHRLKTAIATHFEVDPETLSAYLQPTIDRMALQGSLFLHHLALEGRILFDRDNYLQRALMSLKPFTEYTVELSLYRGLLREVETHLSLEGTLVAFDYHLMQMLIRNTCILLCYAGGAPTFGRATAYTKARMLFRTLPSNDSIFEELTEWHLRYGRNAGAVLKVPDPKRQQQYVGLTASILDFATRVLT